MEVTPNMPKYKCHKEVYALKIGGIIRDLAGGAAFTPVESGHQQVTLSREYMTKHQPHVGGYYVVYKDGYESFSPADAFEDGYTRME